MSTLRRLLAAFAPGRHPLDALTKTLNAFFLMREPQPTSADEPADPFELLAQAQDLCRMAAHVDVKADRPLPQASGVVEPEAGDSVLLSRALEILIEKVYPLASGLRDMRWRGPRLPDDLLPRLEQHPSHTPDYRHVPQDLYSAEEIRRWLTSSDIPFVEGLNAFRFNMSRYISADKLDASSTDTEHFAIHLFAITPNYPIGFVAREYGWHRALEYFDDLWAYGWIPDSDKAIFLRHALVSLVAYQDGSQKPASADEALAALARELRSNPLKVRDSHRLVPALATMQRRVDTDLTQLRQHAGSLTKWLRGLHTLLPRATVVAHLLRSLADSADLALALSQEFQKQYRFYEEIRADIEGCIESQCDYVPSMMAHEVSDQPTRRDAKRALKFYVHGRVFVPLSVIPEFEKLIDSMPSWPLSGDDLTLHEGFAETLWSGMGGGFALAYQALHMKERQAESLAHEKKWRQLSGSPDYKALHGLGKNIVHCCYMAAGMREAPPAGWVLAYELEDQDTIHMEVDLDEQIRVHIVRLRFLQRGLDGIPPSQALTRELEEMLGKEVVAAISVYNTHAAAKACMALMRGVALAAQHQYPTDGFKAITIEWEGLPIRVVLGLEGLRVATFKPVSASGTTQPTVGMAAVTTKLALTLRSSTDSLLLPKTTFIFS